MRTQQLSINNNSTTTYGFDIDDDESIEVTQELGKPFNWTTVPVSSISQIIVHDNVSKSIKISKDTLTGDITYNINNLVNLLPNSRRPHILDSFLTTNHPNFDQYQVDHVTISATFKNTSNSTCNVGVQILSDFYHPSIPKQYKKSTPYQDTNLDPAGSNKDVVNITISSQLNRNWRAANPSKSIDNSFSGYLPNGQPPLIERAQIFANTFDDISSDIIVKCNVTFHFVITLFKNDLFHY